MSVWTLQKGNMKVTVNTNNGAERKNKDLKYQYLHKFKDKSLSGMITHCVKSVQIRSYFWSVFSCIRIEYRKIRTRNNSVFGHFSRSVYLKKKLTTQLESWYDDFDSRDIKGSI